MTKNLLVALLTLASSAVLAQTAEPQPATGTPPAAESAQTPSTFIGTDNDKQKDVVGRMGFDLKWLSGGVSGWYGLTLGKRTGANPDVTRTAYDRTRFGADVQAYLDLLPVGGTAVKAEYITGKTYQRGGNEQFGVPASGWWLLLVQNLGLSNAVALRYDFFDYENDNLFTLQFMARF